MICRQGNFWWWLLLLLLGCAGTLLIVLVALLLWRRLRRREAELSGVTCAAEEELPTPEAPSEAQEAMAQAAIKVMPEEAPAATLDDLKVIEGIGPKIATLLQEAGILTFAQLAESEVDRLREILRGAGLAFADPTTWPEQARLAAAGDWEGLKALQQKLKGGRRVS